MLLNGIRAWFIHEKVLSKDGKNVAIEYGFILIKGIMNHASNFENELFFLDFIER